MSISTQIKLITNVDQKIVAALEKKYADNAAATLELKKLRDSLRKLIAYLMGLDQLKPDYNTNEINNYVKAINLHLAILKVELEKNDYARLSRGMSAIRVILKFHPVKYSFFTFCLAWLLEWIYFI